MKITLWNGFQDKEKISVLAEADSVPGHFPNTLS